MRAAPRSYGWPRTRRQVHQAAFGARVRLRVACAFTHVRVVTGVSIVKHAHHSRPGVPGRRRLLAAALAMALHDRIAGASALPASPEHRWYDAAVSMQRLAQSWGDQPYGAVVVLHGALVGEGPSRVVQKGDADAHAEREAIRDAQRRLGRIDLGGAVLYSTSRPCTACEDAAARAGVSRMVHGASLVDAGPPRRRPE